MEIGSFLLDKNNNPLLPEIQNDYYYFLDRGNEYEQGKSIAERYSLDFTVCVYDADNSTLYFCKIDT